VDARFEFLARVAVIGAGATLMMARIGKPNANQAGLPERSGVPVDPIVASVIGRQS